jgi:hypothetical protein
MERTSIFIQNMIIMTQRKTPHLKDRGKDINQRKLLKQKRFIDSQKNIIDIVIITLMNLQHNDNPIQFVFDQEFSINFTSSFLSFRFLGKTIFLTIVFLQQ